MTNTSAHSKGFTSSSREELLEAYHQLYKTHPHHLIPLESELPFELRPESRDPYRTIMTMILSQGTGDYKLSISLGKLFNDYPNMSGFKELGRWNDAKGLLKKYGFQVDGPAKYNLDRFWCLVRFYFDKWKQIINAGNIETLNSQLGYGPKFIRTLYTYVLGRQNFLPLDRQAFEVLKNIGLYGHGNNIDSVRTDVEKKLNGEKSILLIDFHEMLRFLGQTSGQSVQKRTEIIIGWNAWRLLVSNERERITQNLEWIYQHLVKDENAATKLPDFYSKISNL